jgi:hypothetical protein
VQFSLLPASETPSTASEKVQRIEPQTTDLLQGKGLEDKTFLKGFNSSKDVYRTFCGNCGTHLTYYCSDYRGDESQPPRLDIVLGTLDTECLNLDGVRPTREEWVGDAVGWVRKFVGEGKKSFSS